MKTIDRINKLFDNAPGFIKSLFDHNRFTAVALVIVASLVCLGGCQPKILSPISGKFVTRPVWEAEVLTKQAKIKEESLTLQAQTDAGNQQFETQQLIINQALTAAGAMVGNVPGPWGGIAASALTILSAGLGADNLRKGSIIRKTKGLR